MNTKPQVSLDIALADLKAIRNYQDKHPDKKDGTFLRYIGIYGNPEHPYGMYMKSELNTGAKEFLLLLQEGFCGSQPYETVKDVLDNAQYVEDIEAYKKEKALYISELLKETVNTEYLDNILNVIIR